MAELADAADSKSAGPCGHGGSTPPPGTIKSTTYKKSGDHRIRPLCSNYARTQKVWVSVPPKPLFLTGKSVAEELQTTGRVRSLVKALWPRCWSATTPAPRSLKEISYADKLRSVGNAGDSELMSLNATSRVIVSVPADTKIYIVFTKHEESQAGLHRVAGQ